MRFVDANILLRYLARPVTSLDQVKHQACILLLQRVQAGQEDVTSTEAVIAEVIYVLTSRRHYGLTAQDAAARLRPILMLRRFALPHKRMYLRALDLFATTRGLDFEDALIVAQMERQQLPELYSYDRDFDPLASVTRIEP